MGMTYDQFWNDDVELVKYYRKAFQLKQQLKEQDMWVQGAYFCEAIASCFADKKQHVCYPKEPRGYYGNCKPEKREKKTDGKAKAVMEMFMVNFNKRFEKKGGEENGSECRNAGD